MLRSPITKGEKMARRLSSEMDSQRKLYAFYRGREDREQGKEHPERTRDYPNLIKGSMTYRAYYSAGYSLDPEMEKIVTES
jgi:hypothetical protein